MRILLFQYGDFGDAYRRLSSGGPETYRDQRHTVDFVASLAAQHDVTTVAICARPHDEILAPGLRSIGITAADASSRSVLWPLFDRLHPDAFVCRTPEHAALAWAAKTKVPTLPVFADIFVNRRPRRAIRNWLLGRTLKRCNAPCVANHSLAASLSLSRLGVTRDRIVPWESKRLRPIGEAKFSPDRGRPFRLFFAGVLSESKGVGDCIEALSIVKATHAHVELRLAGPGDADQWLAHARRFDVESSVRTLGLISTEQVLAEMRNNDAVVVPSRHDFAEGLPNTIFEAFASRTPLIASDHPAFVGRLRPSVDSLRFDAGHPRELAHQIHRLIREPELYARLSRESADALSRLYIGIEWTDLIRQFLDDPCSKRNWWRSYSLADQRGNDRPAQHFPFSVVARLPAFLN
jgi:glycosyltransferase involved in cell wall biosynthesis